MEIKKEKAKKIFEEIEVPHGISIIHEKNTVILSKANQSIRRELDSVIHTKIEGNKIILEAKKSRKLERKLVGTAKAHIKNMIEGLETPFRYKLQVASVHFPITLTHDKDKNELIIKNFLGEKKDRRIKLINGVNIKLSKDSIELDSPEIEKAGQTAANIEKGTKVRHRDRRIFQDGIFIIEKPGVNFL